MMASLCAAISGCKFKELHVLKEFVKCVLIYVVHLLAISVSVFIFCYSITNINVTVENSFGSNFVISSESLRTIEQATNSMVTSLSAVSTSYSLNVSWSAPSSLCGTLTGYSVYLDSKQVHILCVN